MNPRGGRRGPVEVVVAFVLSCTVAVAACGPSEPTGNPGPGDSAASTSPIASASPSASNPTGSPTSAPSGSLTSPLPSASSSSAAPSASPTPAATSKPSATPAAGDLSAQLCAKLTASEVEAVLGLSGLTVRPDPGDAANGSCTYLSGDRVVTATSFAAKGARQVMSSFGDSEPVQGLADGAIWVDSITTLYLRKGTRLMGIAIAVAGPVSREDLKGACISLGRSAAGRL